MASISSVVKSDRWIAVADATGSRGTAELWAVGMGFGPGHLVRVGTGNSRAHALCRLSARG
jgi:hypothetical protein